MVWFDFNLFDYSFESIWLFWTLISKNMRKTLKFRSVIELNQIQLLMFKTFEKILAWTRLKFERAFTTNDRKKNVLLELDPGSWVLASKYKFHLKIIVKFELNLVLFNFYKKN